MPQGFEKWGKIAGSAAAQILDCYPILRKLPAVINPQYRHARKLYQEERKLYTNHWIAVKERILNGTSLVGDLVHEPSEDPVLTRPPFQAVFQCRRLTEPAERKL